MARRKPPRRSERDGAAHTISIAILAEIRLFREGLGVCLNAVDGFETRGYAADTHNAADILRGHSIDVLLVDAEHGFDPQTIETLKLVSPNTEIIVLAGSTSIDIVTYGQSGATGFISRDSSLEELQYVIRTCHRGELNCSPEMARRLLDALRKESMKRHAETWSLTPRETDIAKLIDRGCSNQEIADTLHIEVSTVKNHVHNILEKLNVSRRGQVAAVARKQLRLRVL